MRRTFFSLVLLLALLVAATAPAYAQGGKERGDNGEGTVEQIQVEDPPPFVEDVEPNPTFTVYMPILGG